MRRSQRLEPNRLSGGADRGRRISTARVVVTLLVASLALTGCGGGSMSDLRDFVAKQKLKKAPPIEELPPIEPYVVYTYPCNDQETCNDPFQPFFVEPPRPDEPVDDPNKITGPKPDFDRNREELENFPLDGLRMMGTLEKDTQFWGIVRDPDAIIHRVQVGNYLGQNHGKIVDITEDKIRLQELVPDGRGGWEERNAEIALAE